MSRPQRPRFIDDDLADSVHAQRTSSEEIRTRMRRLRAELSNDVDAAKSEATDLLDWRSYVEKHPAVCLGAAAVLGYLIAPSTKRVVQLSDKQLERLAKLGGVNITSAPKSGGSTGVVSSLLAAAGAFAARSAVSHFASKFAAGGEMSPPARSSTSTPIHPSNEP